jgi:hypothetical protein
MQPWVWEKEPGLTSGKATTGSSRIVIFQKIARIIEVLLCADLLSLIDRPPKNV